MLEVRLLGQFSARIEGKTVEISSRPAQLLFIYLVLHPNIPVRRDKLAGLFWPDSSDTSARSNLRHALWRLRKAFEEAAEAGDEILRADDETILFDSSADAWIDVAVLEKPLEEFGSVDDLIKAVGVYEGELLPGFYEDWIVRERDRLGAVYDGKITALLERLMGAGRWGDVLDLSERWIALGGAPEGAYRALMIAHSHQDDLSSATAVYQRCVISLRQELGIEPSGGTRDLYERILEGEKPVPAPLLSVGTGESEAPPAPGIPPYKGLQYFDQGDAELFFGREALTARLAAQLSSARFLAVVGASGSGKSSLVRAGLIPALRGDVPLSDGSLPTPGSERWSIHVIEPGAHPLEALAIELTRDSETLAATADLLDSMTSDPRGLHLYANKNLGKMEYAGDERLDQRCVMLVIDQFEELFTLCRNEAERGAFVDNLITAVKADGLVIVVIALRADFYAHCGGYPSLRQALERCQVYIGPMNEAELQRAVMEPASRGGWSFEPGLVEFLLEEVGNEPGALPLLSHVLLETWKRRRGRTLTYVGYNETGGLRTAIARTADRVLAGMDPEQRIIARNIFLRLTELGDGTQDTRRRAKLEELAGSPEDEDALDSVLQKLADGRLITTGEDTVEVAHEALIREWPTLRRWLNENREALQIHRHLTESAQAWERLERDAGELYRGGRLAQTSEWAEAHGDEMNSLEREFLEASLELARRRDAEREARRQRELEAAQKLAVAERQRAEEEKLRAEEQALAGRRFRRLALWLGFLLVIAAGLALATLRQTNLAVEQTRVAKARELAAAALNSLDADPERGILLALHAVDATLGEDGYVLKEAGEALHHALSASRTRLTITPEEKGQLFVDFSPDGGRLVSWAIHGWTQPWGYATRDTSKYVRVWDANTGDLLLTLPGFAGATFWPDGDCLPTFEISSENNFYHTVWDSATGEQRSSTRVDLPGRLFTVNCDPSLSRIVYLLSNGMIAIHDMASGDEILRTGEMDYLPDVAAVFSPDGRRLATGDIVGSVNIWDAGSGENIDTLHGHTGCIYDIAYSSDGALLATASEDGTAIVWEASSGQALVVFEGHTNQVLGIALSADGSLLATASMDRRVIVWDLPASIRKGSGQELLTLAGHQAAVQSVSISPDGRQLASASWDGVIRVWDISPSGGAEGYVFVSGPPISSGWRASLALNQDGTKLGVATSDMMPKIWDTVSGQLLHTLAGHEEQVPSLAFSPDGAYLVTRSFATEQGDVSFSGSMKRSAVFSNTIKVWDVATGEELVSVPDFGHDLSELAFSPDGRLMAVNNSYQDVSIMDFSALLEGNQEPADLVKKIPTQLDHMLPLGIDFSPDGSKIVTSMGGKRAGIWDVGSGQSLHMLSGHEAHVNSVAFSSDGEHVATASADATARIWDAEMGESLHTLAGHTDSVMRVVFSPDGLRLATGSMDGSAKLWDAVTGQELLTFYGHRGGITDVAFSPDGRQLYTAGMDGIIRVHLLDIEELIVFAHQRVTRDLTAEECKKYLHAEACP